MLNATNEFIVWFHSIKFKKWLFKPTIEKGFFVKTINFDESLIYRVNIFIFSLYEYKASVFWESLLKHYTWLLNGTEKNPYLISELLQNCSQRCLQVFRENTKSIKITVPWGFCIGIQQVWFMTISGLNQFLRASFRHGSYIFPSRIGAITPDSYTEGSILIIEHNWKGLCYLCNSPFNSTIKFEVVEFH